ncbi:MAG: DUF4279 domain-containing protein [Deltaproteobacteria bacterium]|nr:DUF4279 domain-containing protein [Deltaproteobacteria bacterium]
MMDKNSQDHIKAVAISEIRSPRLAVTKQFFAVHELDQTNPIRLVHPDDKGNWLVYFGIKGERYYWVVVVKLGETESIAKWGYCNPHSAVYLQIISSILKPDAITAKLGLQPTRQYEKGSLKQGVAGTRHGQRYDTSLWRYEENLPSATDFDKKLNSLLQILVKRKQKLKSLLDSCSIGIQVVHYVQVDYTWGWHLDKKQILLLSQLGVELDIDLNASGPDLP